MDRMPIAFLAGPGPGNSASKCRSATLHLLTRALAEQHDPDGGDQEAVSSMIEQFPYVIEIIGELFTGVLDRGAVGEVDLAHPVRPGLT